MGELDRADEVLVKTGMMRVIAILGVPSLVKAMRA